MFERVCYISLSSEELSGVLSRATASPEDSVGNYLDPASWHCSMVWSAYRGLPLSLAQVGEVSDLKTRRCMRAKN
jgi:DNA polymerase